MAPSNSVMMAGASLAACVMSLHLLQVLVDISTPAEVFDRVDAAVGAHTSLHLGEFTGKRLVCARDAGEPLKYALCIFYEYCHNGAPPRLNIQASSYVPDLASVAASCSTSLNSY